MYCHCSQCVCVCVCDHFLKFSARVSCRFLKLVIITVRVRELDKCPRLESNGRNVHQLCCLPLLSLSLSLSPPPPPPPPPHSHRGMVYGRQGDIRASLPISWQELSAYPSHASGQTHQLFSQILLSVEEKLLPILSHGQTVQEEWKTNQVSDNEHCKLERVSCNCVEWNLSIEDTLGTAQHVLISEVSSFQR